MYSLKNMKELQEKDFSCENSIGYTLLNNAFKKKLDVYYDPIMLEVYIRESLGKDVLFKTIANLKEVNIYGQPFSFWFE